ncbi:MAG TPA: hypothetical protein VK533_07955 [Sphingomonas sp.]|uniref:hypothetical protein n=1 Tax=Sphingomonas sp. TaxID=28214 RepID=UPI002D19EF2B|nr:hypothetical protein [Sphingomonas sp.]HMI19462.1 hypothetical protein [Sphingomonas sp.]
MADLNVTDIEAPASADERVEEFAEFLDQLEEDKEFSATPADETAPDPSDAADPEPTREPEDPAIVPPVSWDSDAKALFEQLPPELQEKVAAREAQRERAVQSATSAAAEARRNAVTEANALFADQQRLYAQHLEQVAAQMAPQRPDPALLAHDPQAFYHLQAQYEGQVAQRHAMAQAAAHAQAEAQQRDTLTQQHELAQDHAALSHELGDDWTDASRRRALLTDLEEVGASLGYSMALMGQANATDILALKAAAEWKAKADRYDALQSNRSNAVRAARSAPRMAKPGTAPGRAEQSARGRDAAWARAKAERSGEAYAALLDGMGITL